jgi:hypothetical protein
MEAADHFLDVDRPDCSSRVLYQIAQAIGGGVQNGNSGLRGNQLPRANQPRNPSLQVHSALEALKFLNRAGQQFAAIIQLSGASGLFHRQSYVTLDRGVLCHLDSRISAARLIEVTTSSVLIGLMAHLLKNATAIASGRM